MAMRDAKIGHRFLSPLAAIEGIAHLPIKPIISRADTIRLAHQPGDVYSRVRAGEKPSGDRQLMCRRGYRHLGRVVCKPGELFLVAPGIRVAEPIPPGVGVRESGDSQQLPLQGLVLRIQGEERPQVEGGNDLRAERRRLNSRDRTLRPVEVEVRLGKSLGILLGTFLVVRQPPRAGVRLGKDVALSNVLKPFHELQIRTGASDSSAQFVGIGEVKIVLRVRQYSGRVLPFFLFRRFIRPGDFSQNEIAGNS